MATLVDSNVLLRSVQKAHPDQACAVKAIEILAEREEPLFLTIQNAAEFWNAATRPITHNGLGLKITEAEEELARLEDYFQIISESSASYLIWKVLLKTYGISGVQVHDARLVSVMRVYGILRILTFNIQDFSRFTDIEAIHPEKVL